MTERGTLHGRVTLRNAFGRIRLHIEAALWRHGWAWGCALALSTLAIAVELTLNSPWSRELHEPGRLVLPQGPGALGTGTTTPSPDFDATARVELLLQGQGSFESQFRRLVSLADTHGIVLSRGDYQQIQEIQDGVSRVQVVLTADTRYPQLRVFLQDALRTLPAVSLDQLAVRRDKTEKSQLQVQMRLTFWLSQGATTPLDGRPKALGSARS